MENETTILADLNNPMVVKYYKAFNENMLFLSLWNLLTMEL